MADQREIPLVPDTFLTRLYFAVYLPFYLLLKLLGKVEFLRKLCQLPEYSQMADKYSDTVKFVIIYIREAHPTNGEWPDERMIQKKSHVTIDERLSAAKEMLAYGVKCELLVDTMDDCCVHDYGALPERLCLIGADGHVIYDADMGPWGYSLPEVEAQIQILQK